MYSEFNYNDKAREVFEQLEKGAFLTVKNGDEVNTMTIAWGMIGFIWARPMFQVLVRESRHTFSMIENADSFTVSIPKKGTLKEAIAFCGSKSGRDVNKFEACHITPMAGQKVDCPVIKECQFHYECKITAKQRLTETDLFTQFAKDKYANNDYHTMYYGEIVSCYEITD